MNFKWLFASQCVSLGQTGASFQSSLAKVKIGLVRRWEVEVGVLKSAGADLYQHDGWVERGINQC